MASNHPSNYVGLEKRIIQATEAVEKELNPNNAVIIRSERNRLIKESSKVLGEAEAKQKELKGESKYSKLIKKLGNEIDKLA